jgi:hypothetical protein
MPQVIQSPEGSVTRNTRRRAETRAVGGSTSLPGEAEGRRCAPPSPRPTTAAKGVRKAHPLGYALSRFATYSHSIVAGGFELTSYTTRFTPRTSLLIRVLIRESASYGNGYQSAVIPSRLVTARRPTTWS